MTPDFYSLTEKVVASLIVTGQCGADENLIKMAKQCNICLSTNTPRHISLIILP